MCAEFSPSKHSGLKTTSIYHIGSPRVLMERNEFFKSFSTFFTAFSTRSLPFQPAEQPFLVLLPRW